MADASQSSPHHIRRTVHFTGRVQGVGFRYTTAAVVADRTVTGFVRNLPDGRVELVLEGAPSDVDRAVDAVEHAMRANIEHVQRSESPASGEFRTFSIAR